MKKIIFICFIFLGNKVAAQTADELLQICRFSNAPSFSDFKKALEKFSPNKRSKEKDSTSFLDARFYTVSYAFDKRIFDISIDYKEEKIFWLNLLEYKDNSGPTAPGFKTRSPKDLSILYIDSIAVNELLSPYNHSNKTDFEWRDIYHDSTGVFGTGCGIAGIPPKSFSKMIANVKARNHAPLLRQCKSLLPKVRVYGAVGLYLLEAAGDPLNEEEKLLLKKIKNADDIIVTCQGCFFGEEMKISEAIPDRLLRGIYKNYKVFLNSK